MGTVIHSTAAVAKILADVGTVLDRADEKGGEIATLAVEYLSDVYVLGTRAGTDLAAAERAAELAAVKVDGCIVRSKLLIGACYDETWNVLGRPAHDPRLLVWFPDRAQTSVTGSVDGMAAALVLLADMLLQPIHPRMPAARRQAMSDEIRAIGLELKGVVDEKEREQSRATHFRKIQKAMAKVSHLQLAAYKKRLQSLGYRQPEIHEVIPDRPDPKPKKPAATSQPSTEAKAPEETTTTEPPPTPTTEPPPTPTPTPTPEPTVDPDPTAWDEPPIDE